jgi:hypothetical protein
VPLTKAAEAGLLKAAGVGDVALRWHVLRDSWLLIWASGLLALWGHGCKAVFQLNSGLISL